MLPRNRRESRLQHAVAIDNWLPGTAFRSVGQLRHTATVSKDTSEQLNTREENPHVSTCLDRVTGEIMVRDGSTLERIWVHDEDVFEVANTPDEKKVEMGCRGRKQRDSGCRNV